MAAAKTKLVIVESPAKCSKIQSFLGAGWQVMASMGHIRALAHSLEAVGIERNWEPLYEDLATKREQIAKLRKAAKDAEVWLATDDDREGEGIAWHICHILKLKPATTPRIVFHEITKQAIQAAVANPGRLNMNRVHAQQSRAMLDMLVGFTLSPVLWKRVAPKLSAGRCQTPALRLVVERDAEINTYVARNFWKLRGTCGGSGNSGYPLDITTAEEYTEEVLRQHLKTAAAAKNTAATFQSVKERVATSAAPAPLITSTLQQEASALHGLGPKVTMSAAQKLYEAGHITYMRTDNPQLSTEGADLMRSQIVATWGEEYVGSAGQHQIGTEAKPKATATKKAKAKDKEPDVPVAQAAHEAIRPTHPEVTEITDMEPVHATVYRLIWRRAMQSQMSAATSNVRTATLTLPALSTATPTLSWSAEQTKPMFEGWRIVEKSAKTEESRAAAEAAWTAWTPTWSVGKSTNWTTLQGDEVFTKPPGRYTEATLIRELEKRGIGRPSTFASLVTTLFEREYVEKTNTEGKVYETRHLTLTAGANAPKETKEAHKAGAERNKIAATPLGVSVTECLQRDFADLFAYEFTAAMEGDLDKVAEGAKEWKTLLQETWDSYKERYQVAMKEKGARESVGNIGGAEGVKVVQTKKGPLLVRPKVGAEDPKAAEFAPLPKGITAANAAEKLTAELVEAAFASAAEQKEGELLGVWVAEGTEGNEGEACEANEEIRKKKGPYGWYVQAGDVRVPWKPEDTLETIVAKLEAKKEAFERVVGPYTIKKGPYGFYFYKKAAGAAASKKPRFVGVPKTADPATITEAELAAAEAEPPKAKPAAFKKKGTKA